MDAEFDFPGCILQLLGVRRSKKSTELTIFSVTHPQICGASIRQKETGRDGAIKEKRKWRERRDSIKGRIRKNIVNLNRERWYWRRQHDCGEGGHHVASTPLLFYPEVELTLAEHKRHTISWKPPDSFWVLLPRYTKGTHSVLVWHLQYLWAVKHKNKKVFLAIKRTWTSCKQQMKATAWRDERKIRHWKIQYMHAHNIH